MFMPPAQLNERHELQRKAVDALADRMPAGYSCPDAFSQAIDSLDDELVDAWTRIGPIENFRTILERWYRGHLEAFLVFPVDVETRNRLGTGDLQ